MRATADPSVVNNEELRQYEITADDVTAGFARYEMKDGTIVFLHTVIDDAFAGRGLGSRLARAVLDDARASHLPVVPRCPFIAEFIRRHPDYLDVVDERHRKDVEPPAGEPG